MRHENKHFRNEDVVLDGNAFINCRFDNVKLIFRGGPDIQMDRCTFNSFDLVFDGAAANTIGFLQGMYAHGDKFRDLVNQTIKGIRGELRIPPPER